MTIAPFEPRIDGGRLFGRGSCDIKSGLAAMLVAFARLAKDRPKGAANVILACTVDEEFTHKGSSHLAKSLSPPDLAIIAEPTELHIVNRHKGAIRWKLKANGRACHSSTPLLGENAIYRMAKVLRILEDYAHQLMSERVDPVLGPATLSVGRIHGGVSVNVVPDSCEIEIDRRLLPGESGEEAIVRVRNVLEQNLAPEDFRSIDFGDPWVCLPPLSEVNSRSWIGPLVETTARVIGRRPAVIGVPYGTDAGPLAEAGWSCVVIGAGDIAQAHTKDEWIELDQVRLASELYYQFALTLGSA